MKSSFLQKQISRREMLRYSSTFAGSALLTTFFSTGLPGAFAASNAQQAPSPADLLADMRARLNAAPLETQKLGEDITMLSGPGGSVVVLNGPDGKFVVDTFVAPAWPRLKQALDDLGNAPVKCLMTPTGTLTTPTTTRLFTPPEPRSLPTKTQKSVCQRRTICRFYLEDQTVHSPACISTLRRCRLLPQQTFAAAYKLEANGETLALEPSFFPRIQTRTSTFILKRPT